MADLSVVAASVRLADPSQVEVGTVDVTDAAAVTAGMLVYKDTGAGTVHLLTRDVLPTSVLYFGVSANHADFGQPVLFTRSVGNKVDLGVTLTKGARYVGSANAGKIAAEADLATNKYRYDVGVAEDTQYLRLELNNTGIKMP
jgi:hypothetical protein